MLRAGEGALVCDFAEYYRVLDWRALPLTLAATLAAGLRQDSRCAQRISGLDRPLQTMLLAAAVDALHVLTWQRTRDGMNGVNPPKSVLAALMGEEKKEDTGEGFDSTEEFEAWRSCMMEG